MILSLSSSRLITLDRPITTYNGRATAKLGVPSQDHCIIYTSDSAPYEIQGEEMLRNRPISVKTLTKQHSLDSKSRLNYAKSYLVEHNVKVQFIGEISGSSWVHFWNTYISFCEKRERDEAIQNTKSAQSEAVAGPAGYLGGAFGTGLALGVVTGIAGGVVGTFNYVARDLNFNR